jgi:hypothetical protein
MESTGKTFANTREIIDNNRYVDCIFNRCTIVYAGGEIPHISGCQFNDCQWQFEDAAERTLVFMKMLYHGTGENGRKMIDETVDILRRPLE